MLNHENTWDKIADVYCDLAILYEHMSKYEKAVQYYDEAIYILKVKCKNDEKLADVYCASAQMYYRMKHFEEVQKRYELGLALYKNSNSDENIVRTLYRLGTLCHSKKKYREAKGYYEDILLIKSRLCEMKLDYMVANAYNGIALLYQAEHQIKKSLTYYTVAYMTMKQGIKNGMSIEHDDCVIKILNNSATAFYDNGEYENALQVLEGRILDILQKRYGKEIDIHIVVYSNLGMIYFELDDYSMAAQYYKKAVNICKKTKGDESIDLYNLYLNLTLLSYKENKQEARKFLEAALHIAQLYFEEDTINKIIKLKENIFSNKQHITNIMQYALPNMYQYTQFI